MRMNGLCHGLMYKHRLIPACHDDARGEDVSPRHFESLQTSNWLLIRGVVLQLGGSVAKLIGLLGFALKH